MARKIIFLIAATCTAAAIAFLGFAGGLLTGYLKIYPFPIVEHPLKAVKAIYFWQTGQDEIRVRFSGAKPSIEFDGTVARLRHNQSGVGRFDPELVEQGYTLYCALIDSGIYIRLVDMQGNSIHEWTMPLEAMKKAAAEDGVRFPADKIRVADIRLLENGDLLTVITMRGKTPWGRGIAKFDRNSNLIWFLTDQIHHQLDIGPDGTIYALGHYIDHEPRPGLDRIETPYIDDTVKVISPDGKVQRSVSLLNAFRDSDYANALIYVDPASYNGDLLHANSVHYVTTAIAEQYDFVNEGDVLLSLRNPGLIAMLDIDAEKITWALTGPWRMQHDAEFLPEGNILMFDNQGDIANKNQSRVIEINPLTAGIEWEFPGTQDELLYSSIKSSQQRLPNGNTLIAETNNGRLLEVTPDGKIAWEFFIPERTEKNGKVFSKVTAAIRVPPEFFRVQGQIGQ